MKNKNFSKQGFAVGLHLIIALVVVVGLVVAAYLLLNGKSTYNPSRASSAASPIDKDFLRNGSFEKANLSANWTLGKGKAVLTSKKSEVRGNSNRAVRMTSGNGANASIQQSLSLPADQEYLVVGHYLANAAAPNISVQVGSGANAKNVPVVMNVSEDKISGWKKISGAFNLPLTDPQLRSQYNSASQSFSVILKIEVNGAYDTAVVDDFSLRLAFNTFSVVQNGSFESWKNVDNSNLYSWNEHNMELTRVAGMGSGYGVRIHSGDNKSSASYLDQDVSVLIVKGADYIIYADVKGTDAGANTGWISVTQKIPLTTSTSFLIGEVNAMELSAADTTKPCTETPDGQGNTLRQCRKYFNAAPGVWTNISQQFQVSNQASQVWVNIATYAPGSNYSQVDFDNVKLVYKPTVARSDKPVLVSPINGQMIKGRVASLLWNRMTNLGGNANVDYYTVDVFDSTSNKVFHKRVDQKSANYPQIGITTEPLTNDGTYTWQVKAFNKAGQASPVSDVGTFGVDKSKPEDVSFTKFIPMLGDSMGKVSLDATWKLSTDPQFDHYTLKVKDMTGKTLFGGEKLYVALGHVDMTNLPDGDYNVELRVVDKQGRGNSVTKGFSIYQDGFKKINTAYWTVDAEAKESVKTLNDALNVLDRNNEKRDDNTGVNGRPFSANQFDMKVDFVGFNPTLGNSSQAKVVLYVPQGNTQGYEVGIVGKASGQTLELGNYSKPVLAFPFTIRVNMDEKGQIATTFGGEKADPIYNIKGKNFGGVGIMTKQAPPDMPDISSASFDNFRIVWVK